MIYNSASHNRKSIRLRGYDYCRPGAYFVTVCAWQRECLFGEVVDGKMRRNAYGDTVWNEWMKSATIRKEIELDEFVIMPNHVHGIVFIVGATGRSPLRDNHDLPGPVSGSIGAFVAGFKSAVTKRINQVRNTPGISVWQRNYYEHVIRNAEALNRIREYVTANPLKWAEDKNNPINMTP